MHQGLVSWSLLRLNISISLFFWCLGNGRSCGTCYMLNTFIWISTNYMIVYVPMLFLLSYEWFELCLVDLHGVVIGCRRHMFGLQHGWCELSQCWWRFLMLFLLRFKKSIITTHNLCNCMIKGCGIKHGQQKVLHISTKSKLKLAHECNLIPWNVTC